MLIKPLFLNNIHAGIFNVCQLVDNRYAPFEFVVLLVEVK